MGRAEVRGNQQQQACSSGRQKTRQDRTERRLLWAAGSWEESVEWVS